MKKYYLSLPLFFLLGGCVDLHAPTTTPSQFTVQTPTQRAQTLSHVSGWDLNGALSMTLPNQSPQIANYTWVQTGNDYRITLSSALSLYQIVIEKQGYSLSLSKNGRLITEANTAEGLMQQAVGWSLPVTYLQSWIIGLPAPKQPFQATYDAYGHVISLKQAGFTVTYEDYQTTPNHIDLPALISVQNPRLFAKIVIKHSDLRRA